MKEKHVRNAQETAVSAERETADTDRVGERDRDSGLYFIFPFATSPAAETETFD